MSGKAIKLSDDSYIEFEEFIVVTPSDIPPLKDQVWGYLPEPDTLPDVAESKPTNASTAEGGISPRPASAAVNPVRDNAWFSHYDDAFPRWWSVDLQDTYRILDIKLYLAGTPVIGEPGNNLKSFEVQHSSTGTSGWTTIYSVTNNGTTVADATIDIPLSPPVTDRYWRVLIHENNGDSYSRLTHFEAYGYKPIPIAVRKGDLSGDVTETIVSGLAGHPFVGGPASFGDTPIYHPGDDSFHFEPGGGGGGGGTGSHGALHAVRAYHTGQTQNVSNATTVGIQFNATRIDTDGFFSTGQPTRLTVPTGAGGKYIANIAVRVDAGSDSAISASLRRNGSVTEMAHSIPPSSISVPGAARFLSAASPVLDLVPGDYLEVLLGNFSGGNAAIDSSGGGTANYSPEFSLYMLGDVGITGIVPEVGAEVVMSGDTSIANATWVPVPFATVIYDTNHFHDAGHLTRLTVPAGMGGLYQVSANSRMSGNPGVTALFRLLVNGTRDEARATFDKDQVNPYAQVTSVIKLDAGDYVEAAVYQASGATVTLEDTYTSSGEKSSGAFRITKIGAVSEPITPSAARIHISSSQSIANGGAIVSFDAVDYDTDNFYSSSSPTRLTVPVGKAGLYSITGNIHWQDASDQYYRLGPHLFLNGSEFIAFETGIVDPNPSPANSVTTDYMLNEGDYLELRAFYTSASSKSVTTAALMIHKITGSGAPVAGVDPIVPDPTGSYNWGDVNEFGQVSNPQDVTIDTSSFLTNVTGSDPIVLSGTGATRNVAFTPGASVSFQGQQVTNVRLENLASAPTGSVGRVYTDTALNKIRAYVNSMWQNLITDQTALGGAITGTIGATVLPTKGTPGTYAYPVSITSDTNGDITSITAGSAPVTAVTGSAPIVSSGGTTPAISWNPGAAFSNNGQQVQNFVVEHLASAPTGATGRIYTDDTSNKLRVYINSAWRSIVTESTALAGDITGTIGATVLPTKGTPGTYAYPVSITVDANGDITSITGGSAPATPVTNVTGSAPIASSGGTTPAISWNPTAAFSNNGQPVQNFVVESLSSAPTGATGRIYTDTTSNKVRAYVNAAWQNIVTEALALGGALTGTLPNPTLAAVVTAATVPFPASIQFNNGGQVLAASAGNTPVGYFTASQSTGSTIAALKAVAMATTGAVRLADSGVANDYPVVGFTIASIANGGSGTIQTSGLLTGLSGLTPLAIYYSDPATPGGITSTMPTTSGQKRQVVGQAITSTSLLLAIEQAVTSSSAVSPLTVASGTAFPGSPNTNDRFYRTDRGIDYYFNGTSWLSMPLLSMPLGEIIADPAFAPLKWYHSIYPYVNASIFIESIVSVFRVSATFTAADYWSMGLAYKSLAGTEANTTPLSLWSGGRSASTTYFVQVPVNQQFDSPLISTANPQTFGVYASKTGSPGQLEITVTNAGGTNAHIFYRLVG